MAIGALLALLVEDYEKTNFPIDDPDPKELLEHVMQRRGVTRKDFEPAIGQRGRVAEIFNRVKPLGLEMIRRLVEQFDLPAEVLVKPYALRVGIGQTLSLQLPLKLPAPNNPIGFKTSACQVITVKNYLIFWGLTGHLLGVQ